MQSNQGSFSFHFVGDVCLEEPEHFLDEDEYEILQRYMPLIRALEREWRYNMPCHFPLLAAAD